MTSATPPPPPATGPPRKWGAEIAIASSRLPTRWTSSLRCDRAMQHRPPPHASAKSPSMTGTSQILLEIAVDSLADAIFAAQAGADRIELVAHLDQHGLTPSPGTRPRCQGRRLHPRHGDDQARCGLTGRRPANGRYAAPGGGCGRSRRCGGLVFGVLTPSGHVDRDAIAMIVQLAAGKQTVFHARST